MNQFWWVIVTMFWYPVIGWSQGSAGIRKLEMSKLYYPFFFLPINILYRNVMEIPIWFQLTDYLYLTLWKVFLSIYMDFPPSLNIFTNLNDKSTQKMMISNKLQSTPKIVFRLLLTHSTVGLEVGWQVGREAGWNVMHDAGWS